MISDIWDEAAAAKHRFSPLFTFSSIILGESEEKEDITKRQVAQKLASTRNFHLENMTKKKITTIQKYEKYVKKIQPRCNRILHIMKNYAKILT